MIIADTCLVFHLFNETDLTLDAQKILDKDPFWIIPSLWREEYANVLSKLARKENRASEEVLEHFNFALKELRKSEVHVETQMALEISINCKISVYDAHFISLAIDFNVPLVTEDKEILKRCPQIAHSIHGFLKSLKKH